MVLFAELTPLRQQILATMAILAPSYGCTAPLVRKALCAADLASERSLTLTALQGELDALAQEGWIERPRPNVGYRVVALRFPEVLDASGALPASCLRAIADGQDVGTFGLDGPAMSRLRIAIAQSDGARVDFEFKHLPSPFAKHPEVLTFLRRTLGTRAPATWLELLGPHKSAYLAVALQGGLTELEPVSDAILDAALAGTPWPRAHAIALLVLRGTPERAEAALAPWPSGRSAAALRESQQALALAKGMVALGQGAWDAALSHFLEMPIANKEVALPIRGLARLVQAARCPANALTTLEEDRALAREFSQEPALVYSIEDLVHLRTGREVHYTRTVDRGWVAWLAATLVERWKPKTESRIAFSSIRGDVRSVNARFEPFSREAMERSGYQWVATQFAAASADATTPPAPSLVDLYTPVPPWVMKLDALATAVTPEADGREGAAHETPSGSVRWILGHISRTDVQVRARVMGRSSGGRSERIPALAAGDFPARDVAIARSLLETLGNLHDTDPRTFPLSALRFFLDDGKTPPPDVSDVDGPLRVVREAPKLVVTRGENGEMHVGVRPKERSTLGWCVLPERIEAGRRVLPLVELTPSFNRAAEVLEFHGLRIPEAGLPRLLEVLTLASARLVITSDATALEQPANTTPHVQLFRTPTGLRVRLRVLPFDGATAVRPGEPPAKILVERNGVLSTVERNLAAERAELEALRARCPNLDALPRVGEDRIAGDLEAAFGLLVELRDAGVALTWPDGVPLRLFTPPASAKLAVRSTSGIDWFALDGEFPVDDNRVVAMTELLAHASKGRGRFVPLGDDGFLALAEDTLRKLQELARAQELGKGRFSKALLPAVEEWLDGADVAWDADLEATRAAMVAAEASPPPLPRMLHAELRDYQIDGFHFLARRTSARLGAFLADDMGLGKTVQAIALLAHRANDGPALVVAPTSVLRNWETEFSRFAPGLQVRSLGDTADRATAIDAAGGGDVVLVSYGLLVSEQERLASRPFQTVVFDEAHALKNGSTRRWEAARALDAVVKVALTGTPVENRISELHAVFDVLMPGMLGSRTNFERLFAPNAPVEPEQTRRERLRTLRRIVRPFVLRRTKAEVLTELPAKTEITRLIPTSPDHRAYYEALRRSAVAEAAEGGPGQPMKVLAAITRLRRAAIDPRLDGGEAAPPGPKLEALADLIEEIRSEGHRALVFSQFLEVLDRAGERLAAAGILCRRLDGTMTGTARAAEVEAFQRGDGDVFLLSLKAGGVGMNLTAADYVIHLDPWWNPAVEDQATDRAHRLGQRRPVTVVRLVAEGTIEEQVIALHGTKRALYQDVVGEADGAGVLNVEALRELLQQPLRRDAERDER